MKEEKEKPTEKEVVYTLEDEAPIIDPTDKPKPKEKF